MYREYLDIAYQQATPNHKEQGKYWYQDAHEKVRAISAIYGKDFEIVAAIVSVLSVGVRWDRNIAETQLLCDSLARGREVPRKNISSYNKQIDKAVALWKQKDLANVETIIGKGDKTLNFYRAICEPQGDHVVVDRWILRAAGYTKPNFPKSKPYRDISTAIRDIAENVSLCPPEVQATIWVSVRERKEDKGEVD